MPPQFEFLQGGAALEQAHAVKALVFDKTGTLTEGKPSLVDVCLLPQMCEANGTQPLSARNLLSVVAAAEGFSEHPLGQTIAAGCLRLAKAWGEGDAKSSCRIITDTYEVVPGFGLRCSVSIPEAWKIASSASCAEPTMEASDQSALSVVIGNRAWLAKNGITVTLMAETALSELEAQGRTAVLAAVSGTAACVLGIADRVKPEAQETVSVLQSMGVDVWMITGDHLQTALHVAAIVGIPPDRVIAGVRPADKAHKVQELQVCSPHASGIIFRT